MIKLKRGEKRFLLLFCTFCAGILFLAGSLVQKEWKQKKEYQSVVSLGEMEYGEAFLKEAEKLPGIQLVSPVITFPLRLRLGDYTTDVEVKGIELNEISIKLKNDREVSVGNMPVLLVGEKALQSLSDKNGHTISEEELKKLISDYESLELQYSLPEGEETEKERWKPCVLAGIMEAPAEDIYIPYSQAERFCRENGMSAKVSACLLKVRGEENYKETLAYFNAREEKTETKNKSEM